MTALHAYFANSGIRGGWRKVGSVLGVSGAYARELARGEKSLTPAATVKWLSFTGRYREMYEVPACPDCGSVHTGRCHGKEATDVVVLAEGERVVKRAAKPRKRKAYKHLRFDPNNETELALYNAARDALRAQRKESSS
jgi:hypothetical protein